MAIILACMVIPSLFEMEFLDFFDITINYGDTVLFGILIISGLLPWKVFDKYLNRNNEGQLYCTKTGIKLFKSINIFLISSSLYCICYLLPYAIRGVTMDAVELRNQLQAGEYLLPKSIFTTICVGLAGFNIYCISMFYISLCFKELKKYSLLLVFSSFSNLISAAAFAGRDQFVVFITFYLVFYLIFKPFLNINLRKKVKKALFVMGVAAGLVLGTITVARFYSDNNSKNTDYLLVGTLGYIAEQPLVFNSCIEKTTTFTGIKKSFPLVDSILQLPSQENIYREPFNWQFGTMYGSFYKMFGWSSLIIISLIYCLYYTITISYLAKKRNFVALILMFTVYLYLEVTGIFYLKAAGTILINLFYIILSILPLFIGNYIKILPSKCNASVG